MRKGMIVRRISCEEAPWLGDGLNAGIVVYELRSGGSNLKGAGVIVTFNPQGDPPIYEIPKNSVRWVSED